MTGLLRVREGQPSYGDPTAPILSRLPIIPLTLLKFWLMRLGWTTLHCGASSVPTVYFEPDRIADVRIALMCVKAVTLQMRQSSVIETEQGTVANYWI